MDAQNSPPIADFYETMQRFWSPDNIPLGLGLLATPPLSAEELDKRITDLKAVEMWLNLNLSLLRTSIQGLEMQRTALTKVSSFNPQSAFAGNTHHTSTEEKVDSSTHTDQQTQSQTDIASVWWKMLQSQFEQIAQAAVSAPISSAETPTPTKKPASRARKKNV